MISHGFLVWHTTRAMAILGKSSHLEGTVGPILRVRPPGYCPGYYRGASDARIQRYFGDDSPTRNPTMLPAPAPTRPPYNAPFAAVGCWLQSSQLEIPPAIAPVKAPNPPPNAAPSAAPRQGWYPLRTRVESGTATRAGAGTAGAPRLGASQLTQGRRCCCAWTAVGSTGAKDTRSPSQEILTLPP